MTRLGGLDLPIPTLVALPLFVLVLLAAAAAIGRGTSRVARRWFGVGAAPALGIPTAGAVLLGGLLVMLPDMPMPRRLEQWTFAVLALALILACALVLSRLTVAAVTVYAGRHPTVTPALPVTRMTVRLVVGILALVTGLQMLGVPVAPLLTTLGVGSLAVALALQETLSNFFAGLYLLADRPVRVGDYIKIHDGEEGYVELIGWRSSRLRTLSNNLVIVPNKTLSQAVLTNFHLPAPPIAMNVPVTVSYEVSPDRAEAVLSDELARAAAEIPEILKPPMAGAPAVRLMALGESGLVFHCLFTARDVDGQGRAGHEVRMRVVTRLRREGIEIPLPQRVIHQR